MVSKLLDRLVRVIPNNLSSSIMLFKSQLECISKESEFLLQLVRISSALLLIAHTFNRSFMEGVHCLMMGNFKFSAQYNLVTSYARRLSTKQEENITIDKNRRKCYNGLL